MLRAVVSDTTLNQTTRVVKVIDGRIRSYQPLSLPRKQAIVLIAIIAVMVIQSIGDSLARGIGIMAAMAIIRFRTNFKDPRGALFLFASLAGGIASGAYAFAVSIIGTVSFCLVTLALYYSPLGPDKYFDGMLRFNMPTSSNESGDLQEIMDSYGRAFSLKLRTKSQQISVN